MGKIFWSIIVPIFVSVIVSWITTNLRTRQQQQQERKKLLIWGVLSRLQSSGSLPKEPIYERVKGSFKDRNEFELCLQEMLREHRIVYDKDTNGYYLPPSFESE